MKGIIAKRYAKALFQVIQSEQGGKIGLDTARDILKAVGKAFTGQPEFKHVMLNPRFDRNTRLSVLKTLLNQRSASASIFRFFEYLVRKNRLQYLEEIGQAFSELINEFEGIINVPVSTARELSRQDQEAIKNEIESLTGKHVQLQWSVNPWLIGGMVVHLGEAVVDGSIRGQMEAFRKRLVEA